MYSKLFSNRDRPFHFGRYPLERLARCDEADLTHTPAMRALDFSRPEQVTSIVNAMGEYQAAMDAQDHRACLRSSEAAVIMGNYIRTLGYVQYFTNNLYINAHNIFLKQFFRRKKWAHFRITPHAQR